MSQQHELLAVEQDSQGAFKRILQESIKTFNNRENLFKGHVKRTQMFDDKEPPVDDEEVRVESTVAENLKYMQGPALTYFDVILQKESTNQQATGTVVVDDVPIIENAPVTFLLAMETHLKGVREAYEQIPTLQPGISWIEDPDYRPGIYKAEHEVQTFKTKKTTTAVVLYEATDKHPAQIREVPEDVKVGEFRKQDYSGMISSAEKAEKLARLDKLIRAFKVARMQANETEVVRRNIGETLFSYIDNGFS